MNHSERKKHHIVIVGTGFAGLYTYTTLAKKARKDEIEITVISPEDAFTLIPLIHEVASGLLRPDSVTESLRNTLGPHLREYLEGWATAINIEDKTVTVKLSEDIEKDYSYDTLIVAMGSTTNYMGIKGAEEHSLPLKSVEDAKMIKNRVLAEFDEAADRIRTGGSASVDVVIVGGGATGVEVAGELSDFMELLAGTYRDVTVPHSITILDGGPSLVKGAKDWMGRAAYKILTSRSNVRVMLNTRVQEVTADSIKTVDRTYPSKVTIWAAGVKAKEIDWKPAGAVVVDEKSRRVPVTSTFTLQNHPDVYVIGDQAFPFNATCPYPMRAQTARKEGKTTARNILRKLRGQEQIPFDWNDWGIILTFGEGGGVADLKGLRLRGFPAWAIYRITYLYSFIGTRTRLRTALEWMINLFKMRDMGKV
jgi:NADH:ubiquinone reductase (H+-translocating)